MGGPAALLLRGSAADAEPVVDGCEGFDEILASEDEAVDAGFAQAGFRLTRMPGETLAMPAALRAPAVSAAISA